MKKKINQYINNLNTTVPTFSSKSMTIFITLLISAFVVVILVFSFMVIIDYQKDKNSIFNQLFQKLLINLQILLTNISGNEKLKNEYLERIENSKIDEKVKQNLETIVSNENSTEDSNNLLQTMRKNLTLKNLKYLLNQSIEFLKRNEIKNPYPYNLNDYSNFNDYSNLNDYSNQTTEADKLTTKKCNEFNFVCKNRMKAVENFKPNVTFEFKKSKADYLLKNYLCQSSGKSLLSMNTPESNFEDYHVLKILNMEDELPIKKGDILGWFKGTKNINELKKIAENNSKTIKKTLNDFKNIDEAIINYLIYVLHMAYDYCSKLLERLDKLNLPPYRKYWKDVNKIMYIENKKLTLEKEVNGLCKIIQNTEICKDKVNSVIKTKNQNQEVVFRKEAVELYKMEKNFPSCKFL